MRWASLLSTISPAIATCGFLLGVFFRGGGLLMYAQNPQNSTLDGYWMFRLLLMLLPYAPVVQSRDRRFQRVSDEPVVVSTSTLWSGTRVVFRPFIKLQSRLAAHRLSKQDCTSFRPSRIQSFAYLCYRFQRSTSPTILSATRPLIVLIYDRFVEPMLVHYALLRALFVDNSDQMNTRALLA